MKGNSTAGSYFVVRHADYSSRASTEYTVEFPTSIGSLTIPQTNNTLTLNGRDSKVMVTDYDVSGIKLLYSTADILTHQQFEDKKVLIAYGGPNEVNEISIQASLSSLKEVEKGTYTAATVSNQTDFVIIAWPTSTQRSILQFDDVFIYLLGKSFFGQ